MDKRHADLYREKMATTFETHSIQTSKAVEGRIHMEGDHKTGGSTISPTFNMTYNINAGTRSQSSSYPIEESAGYN